MFIEHFVAQGSELVQTGSHEGGLQGVSFLFDFDIFVEKREYFEENRLEAQQVVAFIVSPEKQEDLLDVIAICDQHDQVPDCSSEIKSYFGWIGRTSTNREAQVQELLNGTPTDAVCFFAFVCFEDLKRKEKREECQNENNSAFGVKVVEFLAKERLVSENGDRVDSEEPNENGELDRVVHNWNDRHSRKENLHVDLHELKGLPVSSKQRENPQSQGTATEKLKRKYHSGLYS